ncbi:MAG: DMT family transporter [Planctomycetes bacterium]|nr:DMT family transporter [Planctomycetota bacterium]
MKGILLGLVSVVTWSMVFVVGRYLFLKYEMAPIHFAWVRYALAAPILLGMVAASGKGGTLLSELRNRRRILLYAALGATGCFGMSYFQMLSLRYTQATTISMLSSTAPLFTLMAAVPLGEKVTLKKVAALVLGFTGAALITYASANTKEVAEGPFPYFGPLMALASGASWGVYTALGKKASRRAGGLVTTTIAVMFGTLIFIFVLPQIIAAGMPSWQVMVGLSIVAVGGTAIGFATWYAALKHIEAGRLSMFQFLTPVLAYVQAYLLLGEEMTRRAAAGFVLVVAGVIVVMRSRDTAMGQPGGAPPSSTEASGNPAS